MANYESPPLPAQALAGADATTVIGAYEFADGSGSGVNRVVVVPPAGFATVTGTAAPNNAQVNFRQLRGGAVVATYASLVLAVGTNLVAETPVNVPITNPAVALAADDVLDVVLHQNGTGLAIGAGLLVEVEIN